MNNRQWMRYILRQIICKIFGHHRRPYYMSDDAICRRCDAVVIPGARTRAAHLKLKEERGEERNIETPGDASCGFDCHWQEPYGWVPEAGCPVHDKYPITGVLLREAEEIINGKGD